MEGKVRKNGEWVCSIFCREDGVRILSMNSGQSFFVGAAQCLRRVGVCECFLFIKDEILYENLEVERILLLLKKMGEIK